MIPTIDPKVRYVGTTYLRGLNAETLKSFEGAVVVQDGESEPLVVIVPYATYLKMQEVRDVCLPDFRRDAKIPESADPERDRATPLDLGRPSELDRAEQVVIRPRGALGLEPVDAPYPNLLPCRHCGLDGQIHPRAGIWRACPNCQREGHFNTSECRRCAEIQEAKKRASSPTGVQDESVNYDWKEPA